MVAAGIQLPSVSKAKGALPILILGSGYGKIPAGGPGGGVSTGPRSVPLVLAGWVRRGQGACRAVIMHQAAMARHGHALEGYARYFGSRLASSGSSSATIAQS